MIIKSLLTTAAATVMISGVALAQAPPTVSIPPAGPSDSSTTIKTNVAPDGSVEASATQKSLSPDGQAIKDKHTYSNGPGGTEESHSQTQIDTDSGNAVTTSTTTTQQH